MKVRRFLRVRTGIVAVLAALGLAATVLPAANADPAFVSSYVAVGSDTTMSVLNSFAGASPYPPYNQASPANIYYLPLHSSLASGQKAISSFDAVPQGGGSAAPGCITTKLGGPSFDRPDGSGNGITALRRALDSQPWRNPTLSASCTGDPGTIITGQVDFARSSRGPNNTTTTALTFIPFARDALTYALLNRGSDNLDTLTTAQLTALYSSASGTITVGTTTVKACLANIGSGTTAFWLGAIGVAQATAVNAATAAGCYTAPGVEEHDGNAFYAKADSIVGTGQAAVVNFSVSNWIAQVNGAALDRSSTARTNGVDLGDIDNRASGPRPYNGAAPNLTPDNAYFSFSSGGLVGTYGRDVYNVVPTSKISGFLADPGIVSLFVGPTAALCTGDALTRATKFGFLNISNCGATTLTGTS